MARQSILEYFLENAAAHGSQTALLAKHEGRYRPHTWEALEQQTRGLAAGLLRLGVAAGDRVCVVAHTRLEWVLADLAILRVGGVTVPIYPSNLADECAHIVNDSGAVVAIAEDEAQVAKLRQERPRLPGLRQVVQMAPLEGGDDWVCSWESLKQLPLAADDPTLAARRAALTKDSLLTLIYTSGTTGRPKGVMTTHDNMLYEAEAIAQIDVVRGADTQLFFLPLAHTFAKVLEIAWLSTGHVLAIAENMQTLRDNLLETRPTLMAGVPRVFEKFYAAVVHRATAAGGLTAHLFRRAVALSEARGEAEAAGRALSPGLALQFALLRAVIFRRVARGLAATLGGRMRLMVSGGAPLAPKIAWFFRDAGIEVLEGFGLTETSAATCVNRVGRNRIGSVGLPLPGTEVRLAADGELLIRGRGVMAGYWNNPEATAEALDDGWFRTGDIATIDVDQSVRIVDRKKDIIVTAGGKNVAPQNLENQLKVHPLISQVVVHGDRRAYLTALVTLDAEALRHFAEAHGLGAASFAEHSQRPEVLAALREAVDALNAQLPRHETLKKFKVLEHDFSQESGELTPSLKVKRRLVEQRYRAVFDSFYEAAAG